MSVLGKGGYGLVKQVNGEAIKEFQKLEHAVAEYCALRHVEPCEYIVDATSVDFGGKKLGMELCVSSLRDWKRRYGKRGDVDYYSQARQFLHDILHGLIYLHDRGLVHADVKLSNVLVVKRDGKWRAVLGDCGFVTIANYAKTNRTARCYRDPLHTRSWAHDIYSLGVCMLELLGNTTVAQQMSFDEAARAIAALVPHEYRRTVLSALDPNPTLRPTSRQLLDQLYHQRPARWVNPYEYHVDANFSNSLEPLRQKMRALCKSHHINRHKEGFVAVRYFLNERPELRRHSRMYVAAAIYICYSCFSYKRRPEDDLDIKALARFSKAPKETLYACIAQLCEDEDFTALLHE